MKIVKAFAVKAAETSLDENGMMTCFPSVMGCMDQGADVIFPGFFSEALEEFSQNGFIPVGHKWDELPVAMPTKAMEQGNKLYSEVVFHSTQAGQDARTVAKERRAQGLNMGLSVGFAAKDDGYMMFATGKQLIDYAKSLGCDMKLFDVKGITAWKSACRGFLPGGCETLYEFSIAPAPMNKLATATEVKSLEFKTVCGAKSLPLADRDHAWSASAADKRLRGDADAPDKDYKRAHMICDGKADDFTSYKLPFADLVDGKLQAVPKAIFSIASVLDGGMDGVKLSEADRQDVKGRIDAYYAKMRTAFDDDTIRAPWDKDGKKTAAHAEGNSAASEGNSAARSGMVIKSEYLGNVEVSATIAVLSRLNSALQGLLYGSLYSFDDESVEDMLEEIAPAFDEYRDLSLKYIKALLADVPIEDLKEQAASYYYYYSQPPDKRAQLKTVMMSAEGLESLPALSFAEHMTTLGTAAAALVKRATWVRETRLKAGRKLSADTREKMEAAHKTLTDGCQQIRDMLDGETEPDETKTISPELIAIELSALADEAERLMARL
jgi:hypothetical protein